MRLNLLAALNAERDERRAAVVVTDIASGAQRLVRAVDASSDPLRDVLTERLLSGKSGMAEAGGAKYFLTVQLPPPRLVITGAVHISQALAPMARLLGYDVAIIDPRTAFATTERFPGVDVIAAWPDQALPKLHLDPATAFVALTHDPKIDEPALMAALTSDVAYVGAIGSHRAQADRRARLTAGGLAGDRLARLHAPIGLDLGGREPAEIGLAIVAELVAARHGRTGGPMRDR